MRCSMPAAWDRRSLSAPRWGHGWRCLLVRELARRDVAAETRVIGLVLIAPAVDFTEELMWKRFTPEARSAIEREGAWARPSQYSDEPYLITRA